MKGIASDALDKLRGRSRSGLPSPESEDISRRRESRKGQQLPVSGLSSLARIYADDTEKEEANTKQSAEDTSGATSSVAGKTTVAVHSKYSYPYIISNFISPHTYIFLKIELILPIIHFKTNFQKKFGDEIF